MVDTLIQCETLTDSAEAGIRNLPEVELIRRAQQGDAAAFEHLYRVHSGRVYAVCLRMMNGNTFEAEDLTQEAFLQTFRKIGTFRGESAFSTWLHRLTTNIVLMRLRGKKIAAIPLENPNDPEEETRGVCREIGRIDLRLAGVVDRMNLQRAVYQLPAGYRSVFLLHDVTGYEHHEIAEILGCSPGNSKSQLHKARALLRRLLKEGKRSGRRRKHNEPGKNSHPIHKPSFYQLSLADPGATRSLSTGR